MFWLRNKKNTFYTRYLYASVSFLLWSLSGQIYEGEEGRDALTEQGQVTLQRLENMLQAGQGDNPIQNGNVQSEYQLFPC